MIITLDWHGKDYRVDLSRPLHISIPLRNGVENQPNAFGAPPFETSPLKAGNFVGSTEQGAPINFYDVRLNPHGNGTHTESIGHITSIDQAIHTKLKQTHYVAELVTILPTKQQDGDRRIEAEALRQMIAYNCQALIVRTLPNERDKMTRKYTGTNPPYFSEESMNYIVERNYVHLLTDLPSVDREEDGGALVAHKTFWGIPGGKRHDRTITEMVYVDNDIEDGLYLLDLQIAPLMLDASPSRPVLYKLI